jgi:hypothetical protein
MMKKILVTIVLVVLVLDTAGCFRVMTTRKRTVAEIEGKDSADRIVAVQTREDQRIEFKPKSPARLIGDTISGPALKSVDIPEADVQSRETAPSGNILQVQTKDGTSYSFLTEKHDLGRIVGRAYVSIAIPASEVLAVWVKEVNTVATIAAYVVPLTILGAICAAVLFSSMMKGFLGAATHMMPY